MSLILLLVECGVVFKEAIFYYCHYYLDVLVIVHTDTPE